MADSSSRTAVLSAIGANSFLTVAKFTGAFFSGSGAMFGEAIHTLADLMNQILLYVGLVRSARPADATHPYGYAAESFVWSLISAVGIFFLGCGVTVYHGVHTLLHPQPIEFSWVALGVLGLSFVVDGVVLWVAYSGLKKAAAGRPFWRFVQTEADPTAVAVLLEDLVATTGVLVALVGLGLSLATGNPLFDSIGTLTIGLMLGAVAIWLVTRNRSLLVGVAAPAEVQERFVAVLKSYPGVTLVRSVKSEVEGVDLYRFRADVNFSGKHLASGLDGWIRGRWASLKGEEDLKAFSDELADKLLAAQSQELNALEARVRQEIPQARFVDLESD